VGIIVRRTLWFYSLLLLSLSLTISDAQAGELASRLRVVADRKEIVQWAFLRAMRSETESLLQAVERVQPLLPHMDTLEIILREKVRKEWGQHLAAIVYTGNQPSILVDSKMLSLFFKIKIQKWQAYLQISPQIPTHPY
jgi:hypothetical protein